MKEEGAKKAVGEGMELLAPAGGIAAALAAFDAGADAVYCGLKSFNARERTENFTPEEMSKIVAYAHKLGKKVYVTFNTLIKDSELDAAAAALAELDLIRPDAIIVQDLGVVRIARDFFPGLAIHASTQMGLHNSAGLAMAEAMGVKRVILERQCTLDELELMAKTSSVELEVFAHGALCCCLSGCCILSSWLGGWSGNRGKCKQPCRRRLYSEKGNGFYLSTKDLCALEAIPRLAAIGVKSLKIEGRLRKSDYVASAVTAYRAALDSEPGDFEKALPSIRNTLAKTFGRKWSLGFLSKESASDLIQHNSMGVAGLLCGKVTEVKRNGFEMEVARRIHVGDSVRIQPPSGDEGPSITVTKISSGGQPAMKGLQGSLCFIHCDKEVAPGSFVFKIAESVGDLQGRIDALKPQRASVDLEIKAGLDGVFVKIPGREEILEWKHETQFQSAGKRPLSPEALEEEFRASASEALCAGAVSAKVEGSPFIPSSVLKSIRREFWLWVEAKLPPDSARKDSEARLAKFIELHASMKGPGTESPRPTAIVPKSKKTPEGFATARELEEGPKAGEEAILPYFVAEGELSKLEKAIQKAKSEGVKVFRATSVFHFKLLKGIEGVEIKTCLPLPCCNAFAAAELASFGASQIQAWVELERAALEALIEKSPLPVELYRYGRPPLLSTRAALSVEGLVADARGAKFFVERKGELSIVLSEKPMSIPELPGASSLFDYRFAGFDEKGASSFNFDFALS